MPAEQKEYHTCCDRLRGRLNSDAHSLPLPPSTILSQAKAQDRSLSADTRRWAHRLGQQPGCGNEALRICLDPQQLNKALKREQYPLPVIDDILPDLSKVKVFTEVDARNGYWHVVPDDDSSRLSTFDTPYGRYRWKRLPLGISVASEIFQKRLHEALDRLDGLLMVHDDMVVYGEGETKEEAIADHDKSMKAF